MAKKTKAWSKTRRSNPAPNPAKTRRTAHRRNPISEDFFGFLAEPTGMAIGLTFPEKILDLVGVGRFVKKTEKDKTVYQRNWLRSILTGFSGYVLSKSGKSGMLKSIGQGMIIKGISDGISGLIENKDYVNTIAAALENGSEELKSYVKPGLLPGLGDLSALGGGTVGEFLQLDDGSILNTDTGEIIRTDTGEIIGSEPAPAVQYQTAGLSGNYFDIKKGA